MADVTNLPVLIIPAPHGIFIKVMRNSHTFEKSEMDLVKHNINLRGCGT